MSIRLHTQYVLITVTVMIGIFLLSSMPDRGPGYQDVLSVIGERGNQYPALRFVGNLVHIPLYAILTFFFLLAIWGGKGNEPLLWRHYSVAFLGTGTFAAFDEWYQAFVPGRSASVSDFLMNLVGIGGMLLYLRLRELRKMDP